MQVENTSFGEEIMLLLGVMAEVRPILEDEGLDFEGAWYCFVKVR